MAMFRHTGIMGCNANGYVPPAKKMKNLYTALIQCKIFLLKKNHGFTSLIRDFLEQKNRALNFCLIQGKCL